MSLTNGALLPFTVPVDNGPVQSLVASPDGSQVVFGGNFTTVGGSGTPGYGLYRADAATGAGLPLPVNNDVRDAGANSGILRLASDGTSFYGAGYALRRRRQLRGLLPGQLDRRFAGQHGGLPR